MEMIETPGGVMVRPGEDEAEEAREEVLGGGGRLSPVKRLRRVTTVDEVRRPGSQAHMSEPSSSCYGRKES